MFGWAGQMCYGKKLDYILPKWGDSHHSITMRLTPDSRAPAKADPSARAGVGGVVVVGRCWPYLGAGLHLSWP